MRRVNERKVEIKIEVCGSRDERMGEISDNEKKMSRELTEVSEITEENLSDEFEVRRATT